MLFVNTKDKTKVQIITSRVIWLASMISRIIGPSRDQLQIYFH